MLHPELRRHLERMGAKIHTDANNTTSVDVPGANYRYVLMPLTDGGVAPRVLSQLKAQYPESWYEDHATRGQLERPADAADATAVALHTTGVLRHFGYGYREQMLPGYGEGHHRVVHVHQNVFGSPPELGHGITIANDEDPGGALTLHTHGDEVALACIHPQPPHPEVLQLAKQFLEDPSAGVGLADAIQEHHAHEMPHNYARVYVRACGRRL